MPSTKELLKECNYDNQQDKTQQSTKTVQNRRNRIADGMKQVSQHGWTIVCKTYFSLLPYDTYQWYHVPYVESNKKQFQKLETVLSSQEAFLAKLDHSRHLNGTDLSDCHISQMSADTKFCCWMSTHPCTPSHLSMVSCQSWTYKGALWACWRAKMLATESHKTGATRWPTTTTSSPSLTVL